MVTPTTQTSATAAATTHKWLAWVLRANAAFCALCGLDLILLASFIAPELGVSPLILQIAGGALVVYALFPWRVSTHPTRSLVLAVTSLDVLWVVASAAILAIPTSITMIGAICIEAIALVTAIFAALQYLGWRRLA